MDVARSIRVIQIDSVAIAGAPSQYFVPFSRLGPYDREILDRLVFEERKFFYYLAHAASLVLMEDYPIFGGRMIPYSKRTDKWGVHLYGWIKANEQLYKRILSEIRKRGPLRSRELEDTAVAHWESAGWNDGRNVGMMLERLWIEGTVTVVGRDGNQRLWDLSSRWFPKDLPRRLPARARSDRAVALAVRALGVGTKTHVNFHFTRGTYPDLVGSLRRNVESGEILPATIDGKRGFYIHRDYADFATALWRPRTVLLSPFDNLIADRQRNRSLFGFDFALEIYFPAAKRKRGYYVFPILSGDRLIGSADLKYDRTAKKLIVLKLMFEPGFGMTPAVQRAIDELEAFVKKGQRRVPALAGTRDES